MRRVFADTSYFIAIIAPGDVAHQRARAWAGERLHLITPRPEGEDEAVG